MTLTPCLGCGVPSPSSRCVECEDARPHRVRQHHRTRRERGYDEAWTKLSQRARRAQPFCTDCGTRSDLTTDHSAEAWTRRAAGKPIRLQDIDVLCRSCNSKRGAARTTKGNAHA